MAVAATVAASFALANPASAAADDVLTLTPAAATANAGQTAATTFNGHLVDNAAADVASAGVTVTVTSSSTATSNPLSLTGVTGPSTGGAAGAWTATGTDTTDANGDFDFGVNSAYAGTVTVAAAETSDAATVKDSSTLTVVGPSSVTVAPTNQAAFANTAASYTITAKNGDGTNAAAGTVIHLSASEAPASGVTDGPDLNLGSCSQTGTNTGGATPTPTTTTVTCTVAVGTGGQATFSAKSNEAGTVNITVAADDNGAASTTVGDTATLTVAPSSGAAGDNVTTLAVAPTSVKQYAADGHSAVEYSLTATGKNGVAVNGAQVMYEVTHGTTTSAPKAFGSLTSGGGKVTSTIPNSELISGGSGSGTVKFWVDYTLANGGATNGPDASEPTASASYQIDATPTGTATVTAPDSTTVGVVQALPAGAQTVDITVNVANGGTPVSGASVAVDANLSGAPTGTTNPVRYAGGVTDAKGNATVSVPVTAVEGANGKTLTVTPYISENGDTVGSGNDGTPLTVHFQAPVVTHISDGSITAVDNQPGGTVSVPVRVTDQFNKPIGAGTAVVFNVTSSNGNSAVGKVATIDSNGQAVVSYTDKSGQTDYTQLSDETIHFTSVAGQTSSLPTDITVHYVASTTPTSLTDTLDPTHLSPTVDKTKTSDQEVQFTLSNSAGTLAGQPVKISVNMGFVGADSNVDSTGGTSITVLTNSSGVASAWVGSAQSGTQTITATAGSLTATAKSIAYQADVPVAISLTGPTSAIKAGSSAKFTAKVSDDLGNGVAGQSITFTATDSGVLPGGVSPLTALTGAAGTVTVTIKAGSAAGMITAKDSALPASSSTATAAYTIKKTTPPKHHKKTEKPKISVSSRTKGIVIVTVTTHPKFKKGMIVSLFKKKHGHWVKTGHIRVDNTGWGQVTLHAPSKVHLILRAKGNSHKYIEKYSKAHKIRVK